MLENTLKSYLPARFTCKRVAVVHEGFVKPHLLPSCSPPLLLGAGEPGARQGKAYSLHQILKVRYLIPITLLRPIARGDMKG